LSKKRGSGEVPEKREGVRRERRIAHSPESPESGGKACREGGFRRGIASVLRRNSWKRRKEAREECPGAL
jgi:hypothetical protein